MNSFQLYDKVSLLENSGEDVDRSYDTLPRGNLIIFPVEPISPTLAICSQKSLI